jgi:hypothetical protein
MIEVADELRRSSNASTNSELLKDIPEEFFSDEFRLSKDFFKITNQQDLKNVEETHRKYLDSVESNLADNVTRGFDKFTLAFESFDGIRGDLGYISDAVKMQKEHTQYMKEQSVKNMIKVYKL